MARGTPSTKASTRRGWYLSRWCGNPANRGRRHPTHIKGFPYNLKAQPICTFLFELVAYSIPVTCSPPWTPQSDGSPPTTRSAVWLAPTGPARGSPRWRHWMVGWTTGRRCGGGCGSRRRGRRRTRCCARFDGATDRRPPFILPLKKGAARPLHGAGDPRCGGQRRPLRSAPPSAAYPAPVVCGAAVGHDPRGAAACAPVGPAACQPTRARGHLLCGVGGPLLLRVVAGGPGAGGGPRFPASRGAAVPR